jgi:hypothetical protein
MKTEQALWVAAITPAGLIVAWMLCELVKRFH